MDLLPVFDSEYKLNKKVKFIDLTNWDALEENGTFFCQSILTVIASIFFHHVFKSICWQRMHLVERLLKTCLSK